MIYTVRQLLAILSAERSSWDDLRHYPASYLCRAMLRLADYAVANRKEYETIRLAHEAPELSNSELAIALGCSALTVRKHLQSPQISDDSEFTATEMDALEPIALPMSHERSITYANATELCTIALVNPKRWHIWRAMMASEPAGVCELATIYKVSTKTVIKYFKELQTCNQLRKVILPTTTEEEE